MPPETREMAGVRLTVNTLLYSTSRYMHPASATWTFARLLFQRELSQIVSELSQNVSELSYYVSELSHNVSELS